MEINVSDGMSLTLSRVDACSFTVSLDPAGNRPG
jgi:riboflavin synthase alpha subunit